MLNIMVPAIVLRCCQVMYGAQLFGVCNVRHVLQKSPQSESQATGESFGDDCGAEVLLLEDDNTPAPARPDSNISDEEAAAVITEFLLLVFNPSCAH